MQLKPYCLKHENRLKPWFGNPQTKRWLGSETWLSNVDRLIQEPVGTEFRGAKRISYHPYVAIEGEEIVGFIDAGISDKYVVWGVGKNGEQTALTSQDTRTADITFVVDPAKRGQGIAAKMLQVLLKQLELAEVVVFNAGVEPENNVSVKSLIAAGFEPVGKPDFEGMQYYIYDRRKHEK